MVHELSQLSDLKLRDVPALPLCDRAKSLLPHVEKALPSVLADERSKDIATLLAEMPMLKRRVAWAMGFNLTMGFNAADCELPAKLQRHFAKCGDWSVSEIIERLCLDDLVRSVACEQMDDWQPEDTRPVDCKAAERAFVSLFRRYYGQVTARTSAQMGPLHANAAHVANDAWGRAFECYWSAAATSRYRAAASIPGTIALVATRLAWKAARELQWPINADGSDWEMPVTDDPSQSLESIDEAEKFVRRMEELPLRQRLIVAMVIDEMARPESTSRGAQSQVAKKLGTTEANISILLKRAKEKLPWPDIGTLLIVANLLKNVTEKRTSEKFRAAI